MIRTLMAALVLATPLATQLAAQEEPMTLDRLAAIIESVDPEMQTNGAAFQLTLEDVPVMVITDAGADRMRAMVPIGSAAGLRSEDLQRLMQANFDTALDARYAIANGRLWGVFIHPLSALEHEQFLSGLIQTVNLARTYGTLYSGGAMTFGGGDSGALHRDLLRDLLEKGEDI